MTPTTLSPKHAGSIAIEITNTGNTAANDPLTIGIALAAPGSSESTELPAMSSRVKIKPNATVTLHLYWVIPPAMQPGTYSLTLTAADADGNTTGPITTAETVTVM